MTGDPAGSEVFTEHRALLFSIAYEVLGSVVDAEDAVSETWLRWSAVDHASVENPRAYLARIVTRQALNAARASARRREDYVGPWLPEPLETGAVEGDPTVEHVLTGEAVTTAMLLVLESLTPVERVVFVLREVFDFGYPEIAAAVDKSEAAVRQIAHRARGHVSARRSVAVASPTDAQVVAETFMAAALTGDVQALMDVLAPDAVSIGDGGGVKNAARRPVEGAEKVARFVVGLVGMSGRYGEMSLRPAVVNGMPSFVVSFDGDVDTVISVEVRGGLVSALYAVRNPHKLSGMPR